VGVGVGVYDYARFLFSFFRYLTQVASSFLHQNLSLLLFFLASTRCRLVFAPSFLRLHFTSPFYLSRRKSLLLPNEDGD
jgi:hypothetical protein